MLAFSRCGPAALQIRHASPSHLTDEEAEAQGGEVSHPGLLSGEMEELGAGPDGELHVSLTVEARLRLRQSS